MENSDILYSGHHPSSNLSPVSDEDRASSSSNSIQNYRYDVFISFRGPDTRNTFVDHLYAYLIRKGIFAFKDDKQLQKGESISQELLQAIKDSRVSILVFSQDYASSTWCLDEMAAIAQRHEELKQTVLPVFYHVDPSDVRKQKGAYGNAFSLYTHQFQHELDRVDRWKTAMTSLAGLCGWDLRNKSESEEIENIVQAVIKALGYKFSGFADDLIGIQPRVEELEALLKLSSENDNFRVLGIWGMGGAGKTTLATVLYDRVSYQFEASCYIENVSKIYRDGGAAAVQKQILRQTLYEKNLEVQSPLGISEIVRNRLHNIKLLIVLDNIDQFEQLEELHINPKLLCEGSRFIITTRDEHILTEYGADKVYEVQLMNAYDATKLLCRKAFKSDDSSNSFTELIPEVLNYAQGLPLAIKVMGSFLCRRDARQWIATLKGLKNNPVKGIMKVLQISFEGLDKREREIFLHIACFFKGEREDYVMRILDACDLQPEIGIPLIIEKSLMTIRNHEIHMHGMLQELGKQIVREQQLDEPELWSRLWAYQDFHQVMMTETGAAKSEAIVLDQKESFKFNKWRAEDLSKLTRLKLLILCCNNFSGRLVSLSNYLRYLSWNGYPFTSLPSNFQPYGLVELNISDSGIEQLWGDVVDLPHLKRMDLSNSRNLKETPNFERIQNLERLDFTGCINLWHIHPSIGLLRKLVFLSLQNCRSLVCLSFGRDASRLLSLRVLCLSDCTKLERIPNFKGVQNLEYLDMDRCTSLSTIHESVLTRAKLRFLSLRDCTKFVGLPRISEFMTPPPLESLIFLDLSFCNIHEIPNSIGELRILERLNLQGNNFVELPSTTEMLSRLAYLNLSHCSKLKDLPKLPSESAPLVGKYFRTASGSRDHRSGLYIFNCPAVFSVFNISSNPRERCLSWPIIYQWTMRLVKEPCHFRCGFDIIFPWKRENINFPPIYIPEWFDNRFQRGSIIRIIRPSIPDDWVGFIFCVSFNVNNHPGVFDSTHHLQSLPLPHPFYLSFESEHTEERFDMPLSLELDKIDGSDYLWIIYISRQHCHFLKTGAQITFKACQGLVMMEWGFNVLTKKDMESSKVMQRRHLSFLVTDYVDRGNSNFGPKIQLPYNWSVSDEEDAENSEAKDKEINLFNLGLEID